MPDDSWEARMAQRARERDPSLVPPPMPTEPPACCTEWRLDGANGWLQFSNCGFFRPEGRDHEHHKTEVWYA